MKRCYNKRRSLFAILLLMVMMLQVGTKTFHLHHYGHTTEHFCSDCEHHRVHSGHISDWNGESGDCPLCQMLVSPYVPAEELHASLPPIHNHVYAVMHVPAVAETTWSIISPRGPPSLYCNTIA